MDTNDEYQVPKLTSDEVIQKLNGCSPLHASKVLLDMELSDQRESLEVFESISAEFDKQKSGIAQSLIQPILLSVCDGLITHPNLKQLQLSQRGLTPSRLVNELQTFSYDANARMSDDIRLDKERLDRHSNQQKDDKGSYDRSSMESKPKLEAYLAKNLKSDKRRFYSELEVNELGQRRELYKRGDHSNQAKKDSGNNYSRTEINVDHQVPLKEVFLEYGSSKALKVDDLKRAGNQESNFKVISGQLNMSKGAQSWSEYEVQTNKRRQELEYQKQQGKLSKNQQVELDNLPSKQTLKNALKAEEEAKREMAKTLNKTVLKNIKQDPDLIKQAMEDAGSRVQNELEQKGLGELILLIIKPIFFELSDIFKNGVLHGMDTASKLEAIGLRFHRASKYILENIHGIGFDVIKDALKNFIKYLVNAIVSMFVGVLRKALKIISEGFSAIVQSVKIMLGDSTPAQKADAIIKLLATTVATYISFAVEETIAPYVMLIPVIGPILKDATGIIVSGVASTLIVWLIDQADFFSCKSEQRTKRIKEVFALRIQQIKANTDVFEHASIEKLAQDKLAFRRLSENVSQSIESGRNVNEGVEQIADFFKIDLRMRSSDDFMRMLENNNALEIA